MRNRSNLFGRIDGLILTLYIFLLIFGWINIYATVNLEIDGFSWDWTNQAGRQLIFIGLGSLMIFLLLLSDARVYEVLAIPIYSATIILLICVLFFGVEVGGQKNWLSLGSFRIQPSEFMKLGTIMIVARILSKKDVELKKWKHRWLPFLCVAFPIFLILLQPDTGSALVFVGFMFVLYREGLPGYFIYTGIGLVIVSVLALALEMKTVILIILFFSLVAFIIDRSKKRIRFYDFIKHPIILFSSIAIVYAQLVNIILPLLAPHHQVRIKLLFGQLEDKSAIGYQTAQSLIAIGSGGLFGKGYMNGTQTKLNFVPEQTTDYIFCTVGEEWGFLGSIFVLSCFALLIGRIIILSERQKDSFARIFGYGIASILFIHFSVNIGMTLGLVPVIGIPLPFFSYGGSSLLAFTIMLFIFLRMDANRWETL
jgi:rod shape determining protein RodA|tara:strand:- start:19631 stop:20905 length:1275 start_codon:yes stop_codon:yes gene_type:complete